jgi:hypothetical protein
MFLFLAEQNKCYSWILSGKFAFALDRQNRSKILHQNSQIFRCAANKSIENSNCNTLGPNPSPALFALHIFCEVCLTIYNFCSCGV